MDIKAQVESFESTPVTFCGIQLKKGYSVMNLFAIILATCTMTMVSTFINVQVIYLLRDDKLFNVEQNQIGRVSNDIIFYSLAFQAIFNIVVGYVFDILGRKKTLAGAVFIGAILVIFFPYAAPNIVLLIVIRIGLVITLAALISQPLVNDYVSKKYRGKAIAFQNIGIILGDLMTFIVILTATKSFSVYNQFLTLSCILFVISVMFFFMVKDPDLHQLQILQDTESFTPNDEQFLLKDPNQKESAFQETVRLTKHALKISSRNIVFPICYFGSMMTRVIFLLFSTFYLLWVTSFIGTKVADENASKTIVQKMNITAVVCAIIFFVPAGLIADRYPAKIVLPLAFTFMSIGLILFYNLEEPDSWEAYTVTSMIIVGALFKSICHDTLFAKNLPKDIRGTMHGIYTFFATIGGLWFSKLGGYMHDHYNPASPFVVVAIIDLLFGLLVLILGITKKFNQ